jgi:hypothetical protein
MRWTFDSEHHETLLLHHGRARQSSPPSPRCLERGVSPTATTARCETPLFAADAQRAMSTIVRLLLQARDGVLVRNIDGQSALDLVGAESELAVAFRAELAKWPEKQRDAVFRFFANTPPHLSPLRIQVCSDLHVEFADTRHALRRRARRPTRTATCWRCSATLASSRSRRTAPSCRAAPTPSTFRKSGSCSATTSTTAATCCLSLREAAEVCHSRGDVLQLLHRASTVVTDWRAPRARDRLHAVELTCRHDAAMAVSLSLNDYRQISNQAGDQSRPVDARQSADDRERAPRIRAQRVPLAIDTSRRRRTTCRRSCRARSGSLLSVVHTNAVHAADLAFFNAECRAARDAGEDCVILCHHAPLMRHGVGSPEYWFADCESAFATDLRAIVDRTESEFARHRVRPHALGAGRNAAVRPTAPRAESLSNPRGYKTEKTIAIVQESVYVLEF